MTRTTKWSTAEYDQQDPLLEFADIVVLVELAAVAGGIGGIYSDGGG